jgi:hypothetical protein
MAKKKKVNAAPSNDAPRWHAQAKETQKYGTVIEDMPHRSDGIGADRRWLRS